MAHGPIRVLGCVALSALVLTACSGASTPIASVTPAATSTPSPSVTPARAPSPAPTVAAVAGPKVPELRWDLVPRGSLPRSCTTHGSTTLHVSAAGTAYASGPSLTCVPQDPYLVRAVVKVATYRGHGHWAYLTPVKPSAPVLDSAVAQRSEASACTSGSVVRAVASFVITWPSGKQVRYKRIGRSTRCP